MEISLYKTKYSAKTLAERSEKFLDKNDVTHYIGLSQRGDGAYIAIYYWDDTPELKWKEFIKLEEAKEYLKGKYDLYKTDTSSLVFND